MPIVRRWRNLADGDVICHSHFPPIGWYIIADTTAMLDDYVLTMILATILYLYPLAQPFHTTLCVENN